MEAAVRSRVRSSLDRLKRGEVSEYGSLIAVSVLIGVAVGIAASLFHLAIDGATVFFFEYLRRPLRFLDRYYVIAIPVLGALLVQLLTASSPRTALQKGVAEVVRAIVRRGGRIAARTTIFHFVAPALCIGSGATVGPEGPAAQVGAGVASLVSQALRLSERKVRIFTAAGAGAAIAAVFNAPIGGVFFAVEIILMNDLQTGILSAVILASVASSVTARTVLGNVHPFEIPTFALGSPLEFAGYLVFGALAGVWSAAFIWFYRTSDAVLRWGRGRIPAYLRLTVVSLLLGLVGCFYPGLFGIGYASINQVLAGHLTLLVVLVLLLGKFVFVPLILNAGGYGGIFAPSIFQGAMLGFLYAGVVNRVFGTALDPTTYTLVGMGAVLGGINAIPLAAVMILFEMANNYAFILPLMAGVVVSHLVARSIVHTTPHHIQLHKRGVYVQLGREVTILRSLHVRDVFRPETNTVPMRAKLSEILEHVLDSPYSSVFVVDDDHHLVGVVRERDLRHALVNFDELKTILTAADLALKDGTVVHMDDDLHFVMQQFARTELDELPVVSDIDPRRVIGIITRKDVVDAYNRALARHEMADHLFDHLKLAEREQRADLGEGYTLEEVPAPPRFWGKSLRELNLRAKEGVEVLLISRRKPDGERERVVPTPDTVIEEEDVLLLLGQARDIERVRSLYV